MFLGKPSAINQNELIGFTTTVLLFKKQKKTNMQLHFKLFIKKLMK